MEYLMNENSGWNILAFQVCGQLNMWQCPSLGHYPLTFAQSDEETWHDMTNTFRQNPQMTRLVTIETFYPRSHDLNYQHTHTEAVTSESLDSREFSRFFFYISLLDLDLESFLFHIHFPKIVKEKKISPFFSRKRVKFDTKIHKKFNYLRRMKNPKQITSEFKICSF